jgi:hypothetical protein
MRPFSCHYLTTDLHRRSVAVCRVDDEDLGAALIRQGLGVAYRTQSLVYQLPGWRAWLEGLGVHGHPCVSPSAWRDGRRH